MTELAMLDRMTVEGVNCLGYGNIPKAVMQDQSLTVRSKAIYAYFCALSGSGTTAFPSRDTIQKHLGMGNKSYYANRKLLEDQGYLIVEQKRVGNQSFTTNCFTLVANPKKFEENDSFNEWDLAQCNTIRKKGLKGAGYGEIPRAVMFDSRLDVGVKGVYAYFASYAGAGCSAFPSVTKVLLDLQISADTYQKAVSILKKYGYLEVHQRNNVGGKKGFGVNDYILLDKPVPLDEKEPKPTDDFADTTEAAPQETNDISNPQTKKPYTEKPEDNTVIVENSSENVENPLPYRKKANTRNSRDDAETVENFSEIVENSLPCRKNAHTAFSPQQEKAHTRNAHTKKEHTNNNIKTNNKPFNTSFYYPSIMGDGQFEKSDQMDSIDFWKEELRDSVHYEDIPIMSPKTSMSSIDFLISLMADACAGEGTIRIGKQDMPKEIVRQVFTSLDWDHLVYVLECVANQSSEIKNIRAYYLTALYRAPETMEAYYDQMVARNETESRKASYLA